MWVDIKLGRNCIYINLSLIESIALKLGRESDHKSVDLVGSKVNSFFFRTLHEAEAFYNGFMLALNGLDFQMGEGENYCHIKPLLAEKSRALHQHLMLQEVLSDRT